MSNNFRESTDANEDVDVAASLPPALPKELPQDERYFTLFVTAIRKCLTYKPKFGKGRGAGLAVQEFKALYETDPFYHRSTYAFCREVIGYDLADFFGRYSPHIKAEVEDVLKALLSA